MTSKHKPWLLFGAASLALGLAGMAAPVQARVLVAVGVPAPVYYSAPAYYAPPPVVYAPPAAVPVAVPVAPYPGAIWVPRRWGWGPYGWGGRGGFWHGGYWRR